MPSRFPLLLALFVAGCLAGPLAERDATLYGVVPAEITDASLPDETEGAGQTFVPIGTDAQGRTTYREEVAGTITDSIDSTTAAYSYQATLVEGSDGYVFSLAPTPAPLDDSGLNLGLYESCSLLDPTQGVCVAVQTEGVSGQPADSGTATTVTYTGVVRPFSTIVQNQVTSSPSPTSAPTSSAGTSSTSKGSASASVTTSSGRRASFEPMAVALAALAFALFAWPPHLH